VAALRFTMQQPKRFTDLALASVSLCNDQRIYRLGAMASVSLCRPLNLFSFIFIGGALGAALSSLLFGLLLAPLVVIMLRMLVASHVAEKTHVR